MRCLHKLKRAISKYRRASKKEARPDYNQHTSQSSQNIKQAIIRWNNMYPVDLWWRKKHNVALNSPQHRQMRMVDMKMEWEEDVLYNETINEQNVGSNDQKYNPGRGDWLKKREVDQSLDKHEVDDLFDSVDLQNIQENGDGKITV